MRLTAELCDKQISDEEFEKEILKNEDRYVIQIKPIQSVDDVEIIKDIVERIGNDNYSTTDVGELFSIDAVTCNPFTVGN